MRALSAAEASQLAGGVTAAKLLRIAYAVSFMFLLLSGTPVRLLRETPSAAVWWRELSGLGHFFGFLVLGVLLLSVKWPIGRRATLIGLVAFAAGTELVQAMLPMRVADPVDFLLNLAGLTCAAAICRWWPASPAPAEPAAPAGLAPNPVRTGRSMQPPRRAA